MFMTIHRARPIAEQVERRSTEDLTRARLEKRHRPVVEAMRGELSRRRR